MRAAIDELALNFVIGIFLVCYHNRLITYNVYICVTFSSNVLVIILIQLYIWHNFYILGKP